MLNANKLILLKNNRVRKEISKRYLDNNIILDTEINKIKSNEINKLKNPSKGQIYIHLEKEDKYLFYRFDGKKWIEIK